MIETHRTRIRASRGHVRVLRLVVDGTRVYPLRYTAQRGPGLCKVCGCCDAYACAGGCGWANTACDVCTRCEERLCR